MEHFPNLIGFPDYFPDFNLFINLERMKAAIALSMLNISKRLVSRSIMSFATFV